MQTNNHKLILLDLYFYNPILFSSSKELTYPNVSISGMRLTGNDTLIPYNHDHVARRDGPIFNNNPNTVNDITKNDDSSSSNTLSDSELIALYVVCATLGTLLCILSALCHYRQRRQLLNHIAETESTSGQLTESTRPSLRNPPTILSYPVPNDQLVDKVCPICLDDLSGTPVRAGACMHPVHASCLQKWIVYDHGNGNDQDRKAPSCPVCRAPYQTMNIQGKSESNHTTTTNTNTEVDNSHSTNSRLITVSGEQEQDQDVQENTQHLDQQLDYSGHSESVQLVGDDRTAARTIDSSIVECEQSIQNRETPLHQRNLVSTECVEDTIGNEPNEALIIVNACSTQPSSTSS